MEKLKLPEKSNGGKPQAPGSASELFSHSGKYVKGTTQFRSRLLHRSLYAVANIILSDNDTKHGDAKVSWVPVEGTSAIFIAPQIEPRDKAGFKTYYGTHAGKEIRVVCFRVKNGSSWAQKQHENLGGSPLLHARVHDVSFNSLISFLDSCDGRSDVGYDKKERLSLLLGLAKSEKEGRSRWLLSMCGNDEGKLEQARGILGEIGQEVREIIEINKSRAQDVSWERFGDLSISELVGAADKWPDCEASLRDYASFLSGQGKDGGAGLNEKEMEFSSWCKKYVLETMPRVFGVEILEHTSIDSMEEIQGILQMDHTRSHGSSESWERLELIDNQMGSVISSIMKVDDALKKAKTSARRDPAYWAESLSRLAVHRKEILFSLNELDSMLQNALSDAAQKRQVSLILSNIAVNLCKVSMEEVGMWKELIAKMGSFSLWKKTRFKCLKNDAKEFMAAGKAEAEKIAKISRGVSSFKHESKKRKADHNRRISELILELKNFSPGMESYLSQIYADTLNHVNYKQGETLNPTIEDSYLSRLRLLMFMRDGMGRGEYIETMGRYVSQNADLFRQFWKAKELRKEIIHDLIPLFYIQSKAFDLESDADQIVRNNHQYSSVNIDYFLSVQPDEKGAGRTNVLNIRHIGYTMPVSIYGKLPYEEGFVPVYNEVRGKSEFREIYGSRIRHEEFSGGIKSGDAGSYYSELFKFAISESRRLDAIGKKLSHADMETPHFLLSLSESEHHSGVVTDRLGRNLPLGINEKTENTLTKGIVAEYGQEEVDKAREDLAWYAQKKVARRVVRYLHANLAYYMSRYAELIVSGKA